MQYEKIYHVVSFDNYCKYFKGKSVIDTSIIQRKLNNEKKRTFETIMESVRSLKFQKLPSRITSLFVFSDKDKDENEADWARVFSNTQYILLTLEVIDGCVKWFDYSIYSLTGINDNIAEQYWLSVSESPEAIPSKSIEGLFQGTARIIKIDSKTYSRELGVKFIEEFPLISTNFE